MIIQTSTLPGAQRLSWSAIQTTYRWRTAQDGFSDERADVMARWVEAHTWIRAPIVLAGGALQLGLDELIVGFTRLGNLLGALDREGLPESSRHRIWIGQKG